MQTLILQTSCWLTRTFQDFPGRWRVVNWLRRHPRLYSLKPVRISIAPGYALEVEFANNCEVCIEGLSREIPVLTWFRALLKPGDNILDIGANMGCMAVVAASRVAPRGRVLAFEASPQILPNLKRNIALNRCANVDIHPFAVSDKSGTVTFNIAAESRSALSSMRSLGDNGEAVEVPSIAIDSLLPQLPRIKLIKIDIEGAEQLALQGMTGLLKRDRPYLIVELTDAWLRALGGSAAEVQSLLRAYDYQFYTLRNRTLQSITEAPPDQVEMLCVAKGKPLPVAS